MSPFLGITGAALVGGIVFFSGIGVGGALAAAAIAYAAQRVVMALIAVAS